MGKPHMAPLSLSTYFSRCDGSLKSCVRPKYLAIPLRARYLALSVPCLPHDQVHQDQAHKRGWLIGFGCGPVPMEP